MQRRNWIAARAAMTLAAIATSAAFADTINVAPGNAMT